MNTSWLKRRYVIVTAAIFAVVLLSNSWFKETAVLDSSKQMQVKNPEKKLPVTNIFSLEVRNNNTVPVTETKSLNELVSELKLIGVFRMSAKGNRALIQSSFSAQPKMYYQNEAITFGLNVSQVLNDRVEISDGIDSLWLMLEPAETRQVAIKQMTPVMNDNVQQQFDTKKVQRMMAPSGLKYDPVSGHLSPDISIDPLKIKAINQENKTLETN